MLLDPGQPRRRVDRRRHAAGVEYAEEGNKEGGACRQHDGDPFARFQAPLAQAECDGPCLLP